MQGDDMDEGPGGGNTLECMRSLCGRRSSSLTGMQIRVRCMQGECIVRHRKPSVGLLTDGDADAMPFVCGHLRVTIASRCRNSEGLLLAYVKNSRCQNVRPSDRRHSRPPMEQRRDLSSSYTDGDRSFWRTSRHGQTQLHLDYGVPTLVRRAVEEVTGMVQAYAASAS